LKVRFVWEREYDTSDEGNYRGWTTNQVVTDAMESIRDAACNLTASDLEVTGE
jgi:hypothetical protein